MSHIFYRVCPVMFLTLGCGGLDMPDAGVGGGSRTSDANPILGSSETTLDLSSCGFDLSKPGTIISSRRMAMTPQAKTVTTQILGGILTSQTNVTITGMSIVEDSLARSVSTFSAQVTPAVESPEVTDLLSKYSGGFAAELMPPAARAKIGETSPDWKGVFCSLQPALKLERGTTEKVAVELSKPLPVSPLVISDIERLKAELGVKRAWSGVTAKVVESTDSTVPVGSTWTGSASMAPVASRVNVQGPNGPVAVQAELAVKMTYDFGSDAANRALGLPKSIIWFIDTASKSYKLTQVDFGDGALVNFLPDR